MTEVPMNCPLDVLFAPSSRTPKPDVRAAIDTLARRNPDRDAGAFIDLGGTDLRGLFFFGKAAIKLPGVGLSKADLRHASLTGADLRAANLDSAHLDRALLDKADLRGAFLFRTSFARAHLIGANLRGVESTCGRGA
ncbi:pentapeptide repeat-containing protein [Streptomyces sp. NPDC029006]|uniref:pentapeptide repeat-containing protein n=1 Tax=Streptomyces sp. NPDC029006 TaxID=3155467 RepID=UPI0033E7BB60